MNALLPSNPDARRIIEENLFPDAECGGVQKTLKALFSFNFSGVSWKARHSNFLPIIDFCLYSVSSTATCRGDKRDMKSFQDHLKSTVDLIEGALSYSIEEHERVLLEGEFRFVKRDYDDAAAVPSEFVVRRCFEIVRVYWEMLSCWSSTYKLLYDAVLLGDFEESAVCRNKLFRLIDTMSKEWGS